MRRSLLTFVSLSLLASVLPAQAQEQSPAQAGEAKVDEVKEKEAEPAKKAPDSPKTEKIEVTGSRLKRIDVEGTTQIQVFSKDEMEASGQTTLGDVLREIPASVSGSTREESNRGAPGFSGVNLRGLGEKYTLVLIDGHRLPPDPAFDAVDVGAIPVAMIERIEILKEGASAVYGSDAVGGVVNIITKKAMDGSSVLFSHSRGSGKGGVENRVEAVTGKTFDNGSVIITGSYRNRDKIMTKDRDFIGEGWSKSGSPGSFAPIVPTLAEDGTPKIGDDGKPEYGVKPGAGFAADPRCPENNGLSRVNNTGSDVYCEFNYEAVRAISPAITDGTFMVKTEYEVSEKLKTYALAKYTKREAQDVVAPAPTGSGIDVTDKAAVTKIKQALESLKVGAGAGIDPEAGDGVRLYYRAVPLGNRDTRTYDDSTFGVLGFSGNLVGDWDYDVSYSYGQVAREQKGANGFFLKDAFKDAIKDSAFNPFDPADTGAGLAATEYITQAKQGTTTRQATLNLSGPLGELPGGSIQSAFGTSWVGEDFYSNADPELLAGNVEGSSGSSGNGKREVKAVYAEFLLPATKELEVNFAARYDSYDKFGGSLNPRLAAKYKLNDVLLRASVGTGFRAPTLSEQTSNGGESFPSFVDYVACDIAKTSGNANGIQSFCSEQQYLYTQTPAENVKPEKVFVGNFGAVFSPTGNANVSADYWFLNIKDTIGIPNLSLLTRSELLGEKGYETKGITIKRDAGNSKKILAITSPATNLASTEVAGVDVASSYNTGSKKTASFDWALETTYQLYYKVSGFEGQKAQDIVGTARLPRWRATNTFGTNFLDDHRLALVVRTTDGTKKVNEELGRIPRFNTYDLHYTYNALGRGALTVGAINFANLQPPQDSSANPNINFDLYSYTGRSYYLRVTQDF